MKISTDQLEVNPEVVDIQSANFIGDFVIRLIFSDGHQTLVDFKLFLAQSVHPSIRKYYDESKFKEFKIIDGNLNWNGHDLIFSIDDLYNGKI